MWGLGNVFLHCLYPITFIFIDLKPVGLIIIITLNINFYNLLQ